VPLAAATLRLRRRRFACATGLPPGTARLAIASSRRCASWVPQGLFAVLIPGCGTDPGSVFGPEPGKINDASASNAWCVPGSPCQCTPGDTADCLCGGPTQHCLGDGTWDNGCSLCPDFPPCPGGPFSSRMTCSSGQFEGCGGRAPPAVTGCGKDITPGDAGTCPEASFLIGSCCVRCATFSVMVGDGGWHPATPQPDSGACPQDLVLWNGCCLPRSEIDGGTDATSDVAASDSAADAEVVVESGSDVSSEPMDGKPNTDAPRDAAGAD
jgi:hypothetical protein